MKSMAEIDERVPKPTVSWTQIYITEAAHSTVEGACQARRSDMQHRLHHP